MRIYSVIMAGGSGTRFWPLSRQNHPKQTLNITGRGVMVNQTIERVRPFTEDKYTYVVTHQRQKDTLVNLLNMQIPEKNILIEPMARNTAPCIAFAAMKILKEQGDGIMCVFPADHYVGEEEEFHTVLTKAIHAAESTKGMITIGIEPTLPSTGYGYIRFSRLQQGVGGIHLDNGEVLEGVYEAAEFVEKPSIEKAMAYLDSGEYLWNSGMFVWKASVILKAFERYLPRMYKAMEVYYQAIGTEKEEDALRAAYQDIQGISIDYGIMERASQVFVIPGRFGWNDVGTWDALEGVYPRDEGGNVVQADWLGIDTKDCIIYGKGKTIATIGLQNTIVVHTEDALLICPKERAQDVKNLVEKLKLQGRMELV